MNSRPIIHCIHAIQRMFERRVPEESAAANVVRRAGKMARAEMKMDACEYAPS